MSSRSACALPPFDWEDVRAAVCDTVEAVGLVPFGSLNGGISSGAPGRSGFISSRSGLPYDADVGSVKYFGYGVFKYVDQVARRVGGVETAKNTVPDGVEKRKLAAQKKFGRSAPRVVGSDGSVFVPGGFSASAGLSRFGGDDDVVVEALRAGEVLPFAPSPASPAVSEDAPEDIPEDAPEEYVRMRESISRLKSRLRELSLANRWVYFVTLTLAAEKIKGSPYSLKDAKKAVLRRLKKIREKFPEFRFILVPELHKSGRWHFHGFFYGLPWSELLAYRPPAKYMPKDAPACPFGDYEFKKLPKSLRRQIVDLAKKGRYVYYCAVFDRLVGYCTLTEIVDPVRAASYCTKYISKSFDSFAEVGKAGKLPEGETLKGAQMLLCSKGLRRAVTVCAGYTVRRENLPGLRFFENKFCRVCEFGLSRLSDVLGCFASGFFPGVPSPAAAVSAAHERMAAFRVRLSSAIASAVARCRLAGPLRC